MAGIKSLALKGIRSFGPEENDEQKISFEKPLTLILGQNGCGKTTIIECLRYAITGQMPPGSRNECFVHDAKVNRSSEVLAQVRLKIVNARDKQLEVIRSMKVSVIKNKTKFQTLDSLLSVIDDNGKPKDISSRCADLDFVMNEELGVSKAILNSVIFCHQEDSGWPLEEGKKVKERFDEIFDSDKYSDCFDRLRKLRKEYTTTIKLLEQEVSFLTERKQEIDKKKLEVVNTESKISEADLKISELTAELKPVTEKLKAIDTLQKNLVAFESKKDKAKNRLEQHRKEEVELKKAIKNLFQGATPELETEISTYGTSMKTKDKELQDSYKKNQSFNITEEKIANEKTAAEVKKNKLMMLEGQNQERMDKRNVLIVETAQVAEMEMEPITNNEEAKKGIDTVTEKINSLSEAMSEQRAIYDGEEKALQVAVDECRDELSRHNQKISNKESEIKTTQKDMDKVQKEIEKANKSKDKLEEVEAKLAKAEEDYQTLEAELNHEETQKEINEDEKSLEQQDKELDELSDKISKLQKARTKLKEKEMVEEQLQQKEKQFSVLMNKHKTTLTELLGTLPESGFNVSVNKLELELKKEIDGLKKKSKEKALEKRTLETERKHAKEMLTDKRSELSKAEDQMYKACGPQPYEATLSKVSEEVERLQEEKNILNSSMFIFAKYKSQLKDNSCCPLCNRNFDSENEVTDLISELTTQVMNVPANLEMVSEQLQRNTAKKEELIALKSTNEKINSLKETAIPKLETKLTDVEQKLADVTEAAEEIAKSLIEPEQKMQKSKQIHGEMPLLDRYIQEIKTTTKDLDAKKAQCVDVDTDITLEDAEVKQKDLKQSITGLRQKIKATQQKLNAHSKKLRQMSDKKNKIKEEVLDIQKKVQEIVNLQEKLKQLEENKQKFIEELEELKNSKSPLEDNVKEKEKIKADAVEKNRLAIEEKRSVITKITSSFDKVKSVMQEIKSHEQKKIPLEIEKAQKAIDKLMEKQKQIMIDRDTLTKKIDTLKDEIAKSEIYKRDLEDNLKLRKALEGIEKCEAELKEVHEKLSGVNIDELSEKEGLIKQQTDLFKQKATTEGELKIQQEILKKAKQELQKPKNKDVDQVFKEKLYEMHAIKAIDNDVKEYSVALEKCVMEFHREKMENINLIIREMWRKIYRGNDIDYIEIKTESCMTNDSERRKYDYRVVQCKNGAEIDMRGRCSAGQKVLACLIIRLALAETFSSKFGILALDEPTTNLDEENIRSLCSALGDIVQERMSQKNFMFIIITHDKEFIESLGNIDKVTHYYEVSRNEEGRSRVKKIRFT